MGLGIAERAERIGVVDSQVHVWLCPSERYPWAPGFLEQLPPEHAPRYLRIDRTADELVGMMDEAGVATAFLTSPWLYGEDHSYVLDAAARYPGRFAVVGPFTLPVDRLRARLDSLRSAAHGLGPRIFLGSPAQPEALEAPAEAVDALVAAASDLGMPVFVSPMGRLTEVARVAGKYPEATIVLDHAGLWLDAPVAQRLELLPFVLALAALPNVVVKVSALPELSAEAYPFRDLWRILHPLLDRFGPGRLMWGSDINQHRDRLSYAQSLHYLRESPEISEEDKALVLGANAARMLAGRPAGVAG